MKYHTVRTWSEMCHRWFASKAEARRGEELELLQKAGEIKNLNYQVTFYLSDDPKVTITIDFAYSEHGRLVWEDYKGVLTRDFRTKMAWLKEKYGIEVVLSK